MLELGAKINDTLHVKHEKPFLNFGIEILSDGLGGFLGDTSHDISFKIYTIRVRSLHTEVTASLILDEVHSIRCC